MYTKKIIIIFFSFFFSTLSHSASMNMIGEKGDPNKVDRIIKVKMYDNYYEPNTFKIKKGETVKFEVKNLGELVHEFNIANPMMHIKHQPEMELMVENEILLGDRIDKDKMQKMAAMDKSMGHSHSNSVLLAPKEEGTLIWKFENAVNIEIACNVPGHYQAGMIAAVDLD